MEFSFFKYWRSRLLRRFPDWTLFWLHEINRFFNGKYAEIRFAPGNAKISDSPTPHG